MKESDRLLFLKYAFPCATTLVERKTISKEFCNDLFGQIIRGAVEDGQEKTFKVAFAMCSSLAAKRKVQVDQKAIRDYFWFDHDAVVDERFELMRDFDAVHCKIYPGIVKSAEKNKAVVKTFLGERAYFTDFFPQAKPGSFVVVHREFIAEEIGEKTALKIARKTGKFFA